MRKYGAYLVDPEVYVKNKSNLDNDEMVGTTIKNNGQIEKEGSVVGIQVDGNNFLGFPTPSKRQEIYSQTVVDFGYPEHATPGYRIKSHVHLDEMDKLLQVVVDAEEKIKVIERYVE